MRPADTYNSELVPHEIDPNPVKSKYYMYICHVMSYYPVLPVLGLHVLHVRLVHISEHSYYTKHLTN